MKTINFETLTAPFDSEDIVWRYADFNQVSQNQEHVIVPYLQATALRERLDSVLGPENWTQDYVPMTGGIICKLAIRINGEWVAKSDASQETDWEPIKGAASRSFVRAAAAWGIGRYLYDLPQFFADYVTAGTPGSRQIEYGGNVFHFMPPNLARAVETPAPAVKEPPRPRPNVTGKPRIDNAPLGTKSQVDQIKQAPSVQTNQAANGSYIPKVNSARINQSAVQAAGAVPKVEAKDTRPWALSKFRFGQTKGKMFKDHTEREILDLINYFTTVLPHPTSTVVIQDKKRFIEFLGGKLQLPSKPIAGQG